MATGRNEPCPCGSSKKYKNCCAVKTTRSAWIATIGASAFIVITGAVVTGVIRSSRSEPEVPPGYVWSEEHGHLHRDGGTEAEAVPGAFPPAGSEWSEEHGHYHGPDGRGITWSEAQGVWLDADGNPIP